ncbi:MAG: glycosyltransferase family 39 protein [Thermoanaerobaculia bacterium]
MPKRRRPTAAGAAPRPSRRSDSPPVGAVAGRLSDTKIAWLVGGLAALLRILFVLAGDDRSYPYTVFYEGDSEAYFLFARSLFGGTLYDQGLPFHPPGFAWFLAGVHVLLGAGAAAAQVPYLAEKLLLGTVIGGGSVALLYRIGAVLCGRTVALVAALLAAFHFGLYVLSVAPVADGLFQLLLLAATALVVPCLADGERPGPGRRIALGALLGALALTRAEGVLYALLLTLFAALLDWRATPAGGSRWRSAVPWLAALFVAALVVAPWTIRNAVRLAQFEARFGTALAEPLPRFVPVTFYGPLNLALANHAGADGSFSRDALTAAADVPRLDLTNREHLRWILHGDRIARDWIAAHPGDFARLVVRKWRLYAGAFRLGWTQWNWPGGLRGVRRSVDLFVPDRSASAWFAAAACLAGWVLALRSGRGQRRFALLVALWSAASAGVVALFFGYARLAVLLLPLWLLFASAALVRGASWVAARLPEPAVAPLRGARGRRLAALVVLLLVGLEVAGTITGHRLLASGTTLPGRSTLDRDQPIRFRPLPRG